MRNELIGLEYPEWPHMWRHDCRVLSGGDGEKKEARREEKKVRPRPERVIWRNGMVE